MRVVRKIVCPWCGLQWDTQMDAIRCAKICEQLVIIERIENGTAFPGGTNGYQRPLDS